MQVNFYNNLSNSTGILVSVLKSYDNLQNLEVIQQLREELRGKALVARAGGVSSDRRTPLTVTLVNLIFILFFLGFDNNNHGFLYVTEFTDLLGLDDILISNILIPFVAVKEYSNVETMKSQILSDYKKVAGVYAFQNSETKEIVYVGSSINIARRFNDHLNDHMSNILLQRAFEKYGLSAFNFLVLENYTFDWDISRAENGKLLVALEQKYLDSLNPRYNILKNAGSSLGYTHTEETLTKMSSVNHPMFGKKHTAEALTLMSTAKAGANHPLFGKTHSPESKALISNSLSKELYVYDAKTQELLHKFSGIVVASKALAMNHDTIKKYVLSGLPYRGMIFKYGSV